MSHLDDDVVGAPPVWPAFVDLMAATALVFVALVAVLLYLAHERNDAPRTERERLIAYLARDSASGLYSIEPDPLFVRIRIHEETTFPRGVAAWHALREPARTALRRIGEILRQDSIQHLYREIRILGNADEDPYVRGEFSNWELSAARAAAVARFLDEVVGVDPCRISATGLAAYHPASGPDDPSLSPEQRKALDRRIELEIVPAMARTDAFGAPAATRPCDPTRRTTKGMVRP